MVDDVEVDFLFAMLMVQVDLLLKNLFRDLVCVFSGKQSPKNTGECRTYYTEKLSHQCKNVVGKIKILLDLF